MIFDKGHNKMTTLKEALRKISSKPLSDAQLEQGARNLIGFATCLLKMRQEILENESDNINQSINKDAGRRLELACSKQPSAGLC